MFVMYIFKFCCVPSVSWLFLSQDKPTANSRSVVAREYSEEYIFCLKAGRTSYGKTWVEANLKMVSAVPLHLGLVVFVGVFL